MLILNHEVIKKLGNVCECTTSGACALLLSLNYKLMKEIHGTYEYLKLELHTTPNMWFLRTLATDITALLVGRSRDRSPVVSLGIFSVESDNSMCRGSTQPLKMSTRILLGVKTAGAYG
jgi:hypothetical protein